MTRTLLTAVLAFAMTTPAFAGHRHDMDLCDATSDYSVRVGETAVVFSRADGTPRVVQMSKGSLQVDGREVALTREDRIRIADYEATVRELIPQVKAIALEAVDVAFTAVDQVARTFSGADEVERTVSRLAIARRDARRRIHDSFEREVWSDRQFEEMIGATVAEIVPMVVGDVVGSALRIAFSGDAAAAKELEARANRMERVIEREVESRVGALEKRAQALCPIVAGLDAIESELVVRIAGEALDLIALED